MDSYLDLGCNHEQRGNGKNYSQAGGTEEEEEEEGKAEKRGRLGKHGAVGEGTCVLGSVVLREVCQAREMKWQGELGMG